MGTPGLELDNPLPRGLALLWPAVPPVLAAGVGLSRWASRDRDTQRAIAPALALSAWLVAVTSFGRALHGFPAGFVAGTLAVAAGGAAYSVARLRAGYRPRAPRAPRWTVALFTLAAVVAVMPTVRLYYADETILGGHLNIVAQLQNGAYPPRYAFFPHYELRYHYGFDVLAGMASALLHARPSVAIDVCSVALWAYTAALGAHLGRRLGGARHGVLGAALVMFGGGFPFLCPDATARLGHQLTGACSVGRLALATPTAGYFFQHPFGLGVPLSLALICLLADRASGPRPGRYGGYGLILVALFLGQVVLFLCLSASLAAAEGLVGRAFGARRARRMAVTLVIVAAGARLSGGFAAEAPNRLASFVEWHLGVGDDLRTTVEWQLRMYALLLPLGLAGVVLLRRERLFFALLAAGCLVTPNVVRYTRSWDVVKFAAVAAIVLSLTTSVAVTRLHRRSLGAAPWARRAGVLAATVLTVGSTAAGLAFHLAVWLGPDLRASMQHRLPALSAADWRVLEYLRLHVGPEELVLREQAVSLRYDILGGLHIPWMPDDDGAFVDPRAPPPYVSVHGGQVDIAFVSPAYRDQRRRLLAARPDAISAWIAEGITWFVVEPRDPLRAIVERWVAAGEATIAFEAAPLVVVRARVAPPDRPAPGSAP